MSEKKKRILADFVTSPVRPRFKATVLVFAVAMLGVAGAFAYQTGSSQDLGVVEERIEELTAPATIRVVSARASFLHEDRIRANDTVGSLFNRLGIDDRSAVEFVRAHPLGHTLARQLRPGKSVSATTDENGLLTRLVFPLNGAQNSQIVIESRARGFVAREESTSHQREIVLRSGEIRSSLFAATDSAGIPDAIANQLAEIFSGDIDFHRDLRRGDSFAVAYEVLRVRGETSRPGRILDAEFINAGRKLQAIYYALGEETGGYYDPSGKSLRKPFLRSPLEFSRVTSGFSSSRFHPLLKEWRAHRGVDYGAPTGTGVRATADGVVEVLGRQGGYGNLVVLRHAGVYSTAYGHLSRFAAGLRKGSRVRQGDVIGLVGQTGLASGPHLHYEFRIKDQQVNPFAAIMPAAPPLEEQKLVAFRAVATSALTRLELARNASGISFE